MIGFNRLHITWRILLCSLVALIAIALVGYFNFDGSQDEHARNLFGDAALNELIIDVPSITAELSIVSEPIQYISVESNRVMFRNERFNLPLLIIPFGPEFEKLSFRFDYQNPQTVKLLHMADTNIKEIMFETVVNNLQCPASDEKETVIQFIFLERNSLLHTVNLEGIGRFDGEFHLVGSPIKSIRLSDHHQAMQKVLNSANEVAVPEGLSEHFKDTKIIWFGNLNKDKMAVSIFGKDNVRTKGVSDSAGQMRRCANSYDFSFVIVDFSTIGEISTFITNLQSSAVTISAFTFGAHAQNDPEYYMNFGLERATMENFRDLRFEILNGILETDTPIWLISCLQADISAKSSRDSHRPQVRGELAKGLAEQSQHKVVYQLGCDKDALLRTIFQHMRQRNADGKWKELSVEAGDAGKVFITGQEKGYGKTFHDPRYDKGER